MKGDTMRKLLFIIPILFMLVACAPHRGSVEIDNRGFKIEAEGREHHDRDRHYDRHYDRDRYNKKCPPGHRMKGWCR